MEDFEGVFIVGKPPGIQSGSRGDIEGKILVRQVVVDGRCRHGRVDFIVLDYQNLVRLVGLSQIVSVHKVSGELKLTARGTVNVVVPSLMNGEEIVIVYARLFDTLDIKIDTNVARW